MLVANLPIVAETEKAIQFEVGFKFNENASTVVYGLNGNQDCKPGYIAKSWVPKSCIIDGVIAAWFYQKNIVPMLRGCMDVIYN